MRTNKLESITLAGKKKKKKKERCWKMKKEKHVVVQARLQVGKKQ